MKQAIDKFDFHFTVQDNPEEVDAAIIKGVHDLKPEDKKKFKDMFAESGTDFDNANWRELIVPDSMKHHYQDQVYQDRQKDI